MHKRFWTRLSSLAVCGVMGASLFTFISCKPKNKDTIVLMTEEYSGLFSPFYATSGSDMDIVGLTQMSMLSTNSDGKIVVGEDLPTVVKAFEEGNTTMKPGKSVYTFVLKNGLKFSDGKPLTINDVFFNMYEYLDPVYTGSSTMYSIDIEGLNEYRTRSSGGTTASEEISKSANSYAKTRIQEMRNVYRKAGKIQGSTTSFSATEEQMKAEIASWNPSSGYKQAVSATELTIDQYREKLQEDYKFTLETFHKELESDFRAAKESYDLEKDPYKDYASVLKNDIAKFFLYEGKITPVYEDVQGKKNKNKIIKLENVSILDNYAVPGKYATEEEAIAAAINLIYNDNIVTGLETVLTAWGTAGTLATQYAADATGVILHARPAASDRYKHITGIVSLGHETTESAVNIDGTTYQVAHEHNEDGTPKNANEYDVLQITLNKPDPKAIYNFGFSVAPAHYYTADAEHPNGRTIDIAGYNFGVEYASSEFQTKVIQSAQHVGVPVGAGAFQASDINNNSNPKDTDFNSGNIVYYKANENFPFEVKAKKLCMQVMSSADAIDKLRGGEADYVTPQLTKTNAEILKSIQKDGFEQLQTLQLGYGYIGINAGKVPNINVRKAIMSAMDVSLACDYYDAGTCYPIQWPMSRVNWAYPWEADGETEKDNGHDYARLWTGADKNANRQSAIEKIKKYTNAAFAKDSNVNLKIKFTIAGASITDHPTYEVFKQAAELLKEADERWDIDVRADSQALTKLATGSLEVWAAAWGSTIDPDMYQVYHKNSSATSVYAWGYREIKAAPGDYKEETTIINNLSKLIDEGRTKMTQEERTPIYEDAMRLVLDLAVELPVYQRQTLYAYNTKTIKGLQTKINPYSSPLERIWELELVK